MKKQSVHQLVLSINSLQNANKSRKARPDNLTET